LNNDNFNDYYSFDNDYTFNANYNFDEIDYEIFNKMNELEPDTPDISSAQRQGRRPGPPDRPDRPGSPGPPERPNRPGPPGPPERPDRPRPPRDRRPPNMPPPRIIPRLPRGFVIPLPGTADYDIQYRDPNRRRDRLNQFRNCMNNFTFVWLWNGSTLWFYPTYIDWWSVEGFVWRNGNWYYEVLNICDIFFFNCF